MRDTGNQDPGNQDQSMQGTGNQDPGNQEPDKPQPRSAGENDPELAAKLVGKYAIRKRTATIQQVPVLGDTPTLNASFGLLSVELADGTATMVEHYCRSTSDSNGPVKTTIPDAVPRHMEEVRTPLTVWKEGDRIVWRRPEVVSVLGAHLANPKTDALPMSPQDERVYDQDGDGKPGITVTVAGFVSGEIYLVQRTVETYDGTMDPDGQLSGLVAATSDSQIIDATNPVLKAGAPVRPDPDASKSNLEIVKVEASLSCDGLVNGLEQVFSE